MNEQIQKIQIEKLHQFKQRRDALQSGNALEEIRSKAVSGENIMPAVLNGVEQNCTLGEIADALRSVFGEYK